MLTAPQPGRSLQSLGPLRHYRCDRHPDAVVIDQGGHRLTEDPETARSDSRPTETAGFHPPIYRPPADVQNSGCFVDTEKPLLLQCENCVHDSPPALTPSAS